MEVFFCWTTYGPNNKRRTKLIVLLDKAWDMAHKKRMQSKRVKAGFVSLFPSSRIALDLVEEGHVFGSDGEIHFRVFDDPALMGRFGQRGGTLF